MSLIRRHAFNAHNPRNDEFRQVFGKFFNDQENDTGAACAATGQWLPRVDIREQADRFVILADLPGMEPADIEIQMDKGILSIKGERKVEAHGENERLTRIERAHGVFHRRFALPESADQDGIAASNRNGVLEITIPKRAESTPRRITVQ